VRTCRLGLRRPDEEAAWIERYCQLWDAWFDELDNVVEELKRKEKVDGRKKRERVGMSLRSCEMDVRVGGNYRLEFEPDAMAFFGTYPEVEPHSRLVWTNEEGGEGGPVTTVTFEEKRGKTLLVLHELYSSKEALDVAGTGAADALVETFAQLDELLLTLGASVERS
jgi:hypothetical protein